MDADSTAGSLLPAPVCTMYRKYIENISGERYQNVVNPLYIPVISLCLLLPMALSGFLLERMSYEHFFLMDALCAPIAWIGILLFSIVMRKRA